MAGKPGHVFARLTRTHTGPDGMMVVIKIGDVYMSNDPLVTEHPDDFSVDPPASIVRESAGARRIRSHVADTTARPGSTRGGN